MKSLTLLFVCLSFSRIASTQTAPKKLYIEERIATSCSGGNCGQRNLSLAATKEFLKSCPSVGITDNKDVADFALKIATGSSTLYSKDGDVAYISPARYRMHNLVKDVCNFVNSH
jgi:hypothetical protein